MTNLKPHTVRNMHKRHKIGMKMQNNQNTTHETNKPDTGQ